MCGNSLAQYNYIPNEMRAYLRNYGYSFSKNACEYAVSQMRRRNPSTGNMERFEPYTKEKAQELLEKYGIKLNKNIGYNFVYVMNMERSDRWKSSVEDELHLCKAVKDVIDDEDACPDSVFRCWITKQEDLGNPIPWADII